MSTTKPDPQTNQQIPLENDASFKEIVLYALANIGPALGNQVFGVINLIAVVAMGISPLLMGMVTGIKSAWDGVTDPVMAYITDNTRSRWGRRRPYILIGGIGQVLFLCAAIFFFPRGEHLQTNVVLTAEATEGTNTTAQAVTQKDKLPKAKPGMFASIHAGLKEFNDPKNADKRAVVIYLTIVFVIFTTLTTITSVPYYALGIELSPSYNGRTQIVTYRAMLDKIIGLLAPWVTPFCLMLYFTTALDGLRWVAVAAVIFGIPCVVLMVRYTRERTHVSMQKGQRLKMGFARSIWVTFKNPHFLKIFALYQFIGFSTGLFTAIGTYLNIYWVMGSAQRGAALGAGVGMVAWALGFVLLPVLNWACRRFQKHVTLRIAVIWMSIGCIMKWWCMNPKHPEYQFILPFFFSIGIGSVYMVLSTMMADVTDIDELETGTRREGMFGAIMAFLMKTVGSITPVLAGAILVISGFDPVLKVQTDSTILNMRLLYSFVPGIMLLFSLLLLWRYPLTAERMLEIKAELARRRNAAHA